MKHEMLVGSKVKMKSDTIVILVFLFLTGLNSMNLIPEQIRELLVDLSTWGLLTAIAAVGMKA